MVNRKRPTKLAERPSGSPALAGPKELVGSHISGGNFRRQLPVRSGNPETRMNRSALHWLAWLSVVILSGCSLSGPLMTEEARCQVGGGAWRGNFCEQSSGGGGGY